MFVKLRKKLWLPIKFKRIHDRKRAQIGGKTQEEVYEKIQETEKDILLAKRLNRVNEAHQKEGYLEALNWFAYGSTKE